MMEKLNDLLKKYPQDINVEDLDSLKVLKWFIQRLVENDKIDWKKFYEKNILKWFITITKEEKADSIIMNLSISDNPIDDLISYLK